MKVSLKVELKQGWFKEDLTFKSKNEALVSFKAISKYLKSIYRRDFCYASFFINQKNGKTLFLIDTIEHAKKRRCKNEKKAG